MSKRRASPDREINRPLTEPQAPSPHEEPIGGIEPHTVYCRICGKAFHSKSQLERHRETEHEHSTEERVY